MEEDIGKHDLCLADLEAYFHLPLVNVASKLGLSLTMLKRICRGLGLPRWPFRQIQSLEKDMSDLQEKMCTRLPAAEQSR
ncbi:unnamed protein product [Phaeothamnion confervicola]